MSPRSLVDHVSTFQGTDSHLAFSKGNTLPLTTRPHGMVGWIPQTDPGNWAFDFRSPTLQGFRATHQPSPWIGDYGNFLLLLGSGPQPPLTVVDGESYYPKAETVARPHYFRTRLVRHDIVAEIAPTERGAHLRFTYEPRENAWLTFRPAAGKIISVDRDRRLILGVSSAIAPGAAVPGEFGCCFAAELSTRFLDFGVIDVTGAPPAPDDPSQLVWLKLDRPAHGQITVKIATSFISVDQALLNLRRELGDATFDQTRAAAETDWNHRLAAIEIEGASDVQRQTFYGCLYRSLLYPRIAHEFNTAGAQIHRSFFHAEGAVTPGPLYTDIGFWDAHRSLMPLLTLIAPEQHGEMIQGWVNAFQEGGWLPSWASPGYIPCMVGSHAGVAIADAYLKGIRNFDIASAYAAVRHDASQEPPSFACGRSGLARFNELGWVPDDELDHSAARTCDYAFGDFGAGQFARALGHRADADRFHRRALNYRHLYDPRVGFLRGRNADGSFPPHFREFAWTRDYIEGGPWQHTWSAPHDAAGLAALMGGEEAFIVKLDRLLALPPHYEIGRYHATIHEMTEMAAVPFGQYAHSNEPVHHVLSLFTAAGRPDRTQYWVRRVLNELYSPEAFCGDEDNGAMGSWFVLHSLGLYALTPGHPAWVLGSPLFDSATIRLPNGGAFRIRAEEQAPDACYVRDVKLNRTSVTSLELPHAAIRDGAELVFSMSRSPETARERGKLSRPFSLSTTA